MQRTQRKPQKIAKFLRPLRNLCALCVNLMFSDMNKVKSISTILPITPRVWLAVALLVIVSSFEVIKVIHVDHHHHDTEVAVCTEADETDACHRFLIHFDTKAGCEHTYHLDTLVVCCEICDALITTYLFEVGPIVYDPIQFDEIIQTESPQKKTNSATAAIPFLRGPPALS